MNTSKHKNLNIKIYTFYTLRYSFLFLELRLRQSNL
jgi:hypothetical protein